MTRRNRIEFVFSLLRRTDQRRLRGVELLPSSEPVAAWEINKPAAGFTFLERILRDLRQLAKNDPSSRSLPTFTCGWFVYEAKSTIGSLTTSHFIEIDWLRPAGVNLLFSRGHMWSRSSRAHARTICSNFTQSGILRSLQSVNLSSPA